MPSGVGKPPKHDPAGSAMVYGDFEFCLVEVIRDPARLWRWRGLGERDFSPGLRRRVHPAEIANPFEHVRPPAAYPSWSSGRASPWWPCRKRRQTPRSGLLCHGGYIRTPAVRHAGLHRQAWGGAFQRLDTGHLVDRNGLPALFGGCGGGLIDRADHLVSNSGSGFGVSQ